MHSRFCIAALIASVGVFSTRGQSNIDPAHSLASSALIDALNWLPSAQDGPVINQYYCAGYVYGSNVGWIRLGSGKPADGLRYRNDSASDFGVNVSASGELSGFAYGANIGWISFAPGGNPRVDWATGKLSGSVWSANAGWISLGDEGQFVRIESLPQPPDTDGDGLPDAWEIQLVGTLSALSGEVDNDHDGQTNLQEYLAGTDPFDENDFVGPLRLFVDASGRTLQFPTKVGYLYRIEQRSAFGSGNWSLAQSEPLPGTGGTVSFAQPASGSSEPVFYRVVAYPPLTQFN